MKVTPVGRAPDSEIDGVGMPLAVTVKLPGLPAVNVAFEADVIEGAVSAWTIVVEPSATGGKYGGVPELPVVG
jgi:hypothetical protein